MIIPQLSSTWNDTAEGGGQPEVNGQELTYEYLKAFYDHVLEHPAILKELTDEIHIKSRAKAGGKLHAKKEEGETEAMPDGIRINAARAGGTLLEGSNDQFTIIPVVLMKEKVTNRALKEYKEFANDVHWAEGIPIVGPHYPGQPPTNHLTPKAGKIRNIRLNPEKKRVEGEALLFNNMIDPADLARIQAGEQFAGSIGYFCNEEKLQSPQKWIDGDEYTTIEKAPFFFDHFSMVAHGACDLPQCGFNVNAKVEVIEMTEEIPKVEAPKANTEIKPDEAPVINVAAPTVNVDMSTVLTEMKSLGAQIAEIKVNMASKDAEIATLKAAEEVRLNAQRATEDKLIADTVERMLLPAFKAEKDAHIVAFKANSALWIAQNTDKIDFAAYAKSVKIEPTSQPFVPHVNASEDDELAGLMPSDEDLMKRVR